MTDTLYRQWSMLRAIPREPAFASTAEIHNRLAQKGFEVTKRSVERDLDKLYNEFGYTSRKEGRTSLWYWPKASTGLDIPGMDPETALLMNLAGRHVADLLPASATKRLQPWFRRAEEVLGSQETNAFAGWTRRVRLIPRGPLQLRPEVDPTVREVIFDAVLRRRAFTGHYRARHSEGAKEMTFHPQGLVLREGVFYLVAAVWDYDDPRHFVLHRYTSASPLDEPARRLEGFDLDQHLDEDKAFSYPVSGRNLKLVMRVSPGIARHLEECPLCRDQTIVPLNEDWSTVTATMPDTEDLRWWLLGMGCNVVIEMPVALRAELISQLSSMTNNYR